MVEFEKLTDFDREIWAEELENFVPRKIFDFHAHLWDNRFLPDGGKPLLDTDFAALDRWSKTVFPRRDVEYLLLGFPYVGMKLEKFHQFMADEIEKSPNKLGSTVISPQMSAEELEYLVKKYRFCGIKPYFTFAADPGHCRITDYFPEKLIETADAEKLCVTLHMAGVDSIADPENLADLRYLTAKYPNVRWILAHCCRSFNAYILERAVFPLRDLPNICYDLSAVCDIRSIWLLFKYENISRIMFGTDNIIAGGMRGTYITWGRGWQYFSGADLAHCHSASTLVCYENLRAVRRAAEMAELSQTDIENIFYNNAKQFFGKSVNK